MADQWRGSDGRGELTAPNLFELRGETFHSLLQLQDSVLPLAPFDGKARMIHNWQPVALVNG